MNILNKNEVLLGDIVIFKAEKNSWLGKIIGFLTNSEVSHAGMIYPVVVKNNDTDKHIMDVSTEKIENIRTFSFYDFPCEDKDTTTVYILRHPQHASIGPVIEKARQYLDEKIKFNMPALFLLAGLLVYRKIPAANALYPFVGAILRTVCSTINTWLQEGHPERAMVCSQLVYQCYHACGEPYTIVIKAGNMQSDAQAAGIRLLDYCAVPSVGESSNEQEFITQQESVELDQLFFKKMLTTLKNKSAAYLDAPLLKPPTDIIDAASAFDKRVREIAKQLGVPLEALFVTPADLYKHTQNLSLKGVMYLKWPED